jgi:hypothetical protein
VLLSHPVAVVTTVCVVQPRFAPPLFYLRRCLDADVVVLLDSAQFSRKSRDAAGRLTFTGQAHTRLVLGGEARWVGLPVEGGRRPIDRTGLRLDRSGARELRGRLREAAGAAGEAVAELVLGSATLAEANRAVLDLVWSELGARPATVVSDRDVLDHDGLAGSEWMLALTEAVGARRYLAGGSAVAHYLDAAAFEATGVEVVVQSWSEPARDRPHWEPGLSVLDVLDDVGRAGARALLGLEDALSARRREIPAARAS